MAEPNGMPEGCGTCRFFRRNQVGQPVGVCRARPPVPIMAGMVQHSVRGPIPMINTYWPEIPDTEWCGDFARKAYGMGIDLSKLAVEELEGQG